MQSSTKGSHPECLPQQMAAWSRTRGRRGCTDRHTSQYRYPVQGVHTYALQQVWWDCADSTGQAAPSHKCFIAHVGCTQRLQHMHTYLSALAAAAHGTENVGFVHLPFLVKCLCRQRRFIRNLLTRLQALTDDVLAPADLGGLLSIIILSFSLSHTSLCFYTKAQLPFSNNVSRTDALALTTSSFGLSFSLLPPCHPSPSYASSSDSSRLRVVGLKPQRDIGNGRDISNGRGIGLGCMVLTSHGDTQGAIKSTSNRPTPGEMENQGKVYQQHRLHGMWLRLKPTHISSRIKRTRWW